MFQFVRIRDKEAIISRIRIPKDKLKVVQSIISKSNISRDVKKVIKKLYDVCCCTCGCIPTLDD
jgi:hypothetical protein